nr:uncharacterized protein LOC106680963 [Halyomorpha halys]
MFKAVQEETPTALEPLSDIQIGSFTWKGFKWITVIDLFSKVAMAHLAQDRTAEAVLVALRAWFQFYGVPRWIFSDGGQEFDNATIRGEMETLEVEWYINTPGHPKSRGGIERLHSTLSDHLWVYHADNGLEPDEAIVRAIAAYNHSIRTTTGFSPFEVLFGLQERSRNFMATAEADGEIVNHGIVIRSAKRTTCAL